MEIHVQQNLKQNHHPIWKSIHVYCDEPWDELFPVLNHAFQKLKLEYDIDSFFIRYWETAPHIRWRVYTTENSFRQVVAPFMEEAIDTYFQQQNPCSSHPDGACKVWSMYEPENERYGGKDAIHLSEMLFCRSSEAVLQYFSRRSIHKCDCNRAAILMHLILLKQMGFDVISVCELFRLKFRAWGTFLQNRIASTDTVTSGNESIMDRIRAKVMLDLADDRLLQREILNQVLQYPVNEIVDAPWLEKWESDTNSLALHMRDASRTGKLRVADDYYKSFAVSVAAELADLFSILADHIHMTNNRLGLTNVEELYVAQFIVSIYEDPITNRNGAGDGGLDNHSAT